MKICHKYVLEKRYSKISINEKKLPEEKFPAVLLLIICWIDRLFDNYCLVALGIERLLVGTCSFISELLCGNS